MKLLIVQLLIAFAAAHPGLLRVPKVYNAVITSNQNLSPSRAFPVIQPVIHRTAIGYVPPYYYTQIAPHFAGPEVIHLPHGAGKPSLPGQADAHSPSSEAAAEAEAQATGAEEGSKAKQESTNEKNPNENRKDGNAGDKKDEQVPLSFYPNYQSLYYDPYFYAYNTFNPHFVPGTYYIDYQPYGPLAPLPPAAPVNGQAEQLLPAYHEEKKQRPKESDKEKIPDVPPPPLPTAAAKNS